MKTKFTEGNWTFELFDTGEGFDDLQIKGRNGECIINGCGCCGSPYGDNKHDATLIASAPDLYTALEELVFLHRHKYGLDGAFDHELVMAERALKKARGE